MTRFVAWVGVFIRGFCMGTADLVPGVSGGTIAFITGIYQRLLAALAGFASPTFLRALFSGHLPTAWRVVDMTFLGILFAGIITAIGMLSSLLHYLLEAHAHLLLGFFLGLVIASVIVVARQIRNINLQHIITALLFAAVTFAVVTMDEANASGSGLVGIFAGGVVAISAMLLPGISGSYILLVIGLYPGLIEAVNGRDWPVLLTFIAGCATGILLFSRLLTMLLERFRAATMVALVGIMVGALPKLWPWKEHGEGAKIILQDNVLPGDFAGRPDVMGVMALLAVGFVMVLLVDRLVGKAKL